MVSGRLGWVQSVAVEPGTSGLSLGQATESLRYGTLCPASSSSPSLVTSQPYEVLLFRRNIRICSPAGRIRCVFRKHSGVYTLSLHPTLSILVTAGRDASARVWDVRIKVQIHVLTGHTATVADVKCQESDPQLITGSMDTTARSQDLAAGKTTTTLTYRKKSICALATHPTEYSFAIASAGRNSIKKVEVPQ